MILYSIFHITKAKQKEKILAKQVGHMSFQGLSDDGTKCSSLPRPGDKKSWPSKPAVSSFLVTRLPSPKSICCLELIRGHCPFCSEDTPLTRGTAFCPIATLTLGTWVIQAGEFLQWPPWLSIPLMTGSRHCDSHAWHSDLHMQHENTRPRQQILQWCSLSPPLRANTEIGISISLVFPRRGTERHLFVRS